MAALYSTTLVVAVIDEAEHDTDGAVYQVCRVTGVLCQQAQPQIHASGCIGGARKQRISACFDTFIKC